MKYGEQEVSVRALMRRPWFDCEMRMRLNQRKCRQYAQEKLDGDKFPPPDVFVDPETELFWVGDGFHRIMAESMNEA